MFFFFFLDKNKRNKKKSRPKKAIASTARSRISIYAPFARFYLFPKLVFILKLNLPLYPRRLISLFRFFSLYRLFLAGKSSFKKLGFKLNCGATFILWKICAICYTHRRIWYNVFRKWNQAIPFYFRL